MFLKRITLTNFLSYGETVPAIELGPLNVIIGPNGSGKSNLIEAIELLRATPKDLLTPIRDGGGRPGLALEGRIQAARGEDRRCRQ